MSAKQDENEINVVSCDEYEQHSEILKDGNMNEKWRNLPESSRVDIEFRDLSYSVLESRKDKKILLRNVNGMFRSGELSGILGPSGAGKSTLLNVLAGYRCLGETGYITTNGQPRNLRQFRKTSRYIMQEDLVQPHLTVMEAMMIAAHLKLGATMTCKQKRAAIKEILTMLGLESTARRSTTLLSGGEKKRLSISLELVNNPAVLFLDEPTTGLDESSSLQCVSLLKMLAQGGRTVICSIHTPSASIFSKFDHIYVMAGGQCTYQGSHTNILPYLSNMGLQCPIHYNIADFVIELSSGDYGDEHVPKMIAAINNGKIYKWSPKLSETQGQFPAIDLDDVSDSFQYTGSSYRRRHLSSTHLNKCNVSVWLQFQYLTYRTFIQMFRNMNYLLLKIYMYTFLGIMTGMTFYNMGHDASKTLFNFGYCYIVVVVCFYIPMLPTLIKFPLEVNLLKREYFNKWYSLNAYYLAVNICYIPMEMAVSASFCIVSYYMTDQPLELVRSIQFFIVCMLVVMISLNLGMAISSSFNILNSSFIGPVLGTPLMLLAVHNLGVGSKDTPYIVRLLMHVSYLRFGVEGLTVSLYGSNRTRLHCPSNEEYCQFTYPKELIKQVGMEDSTYLFAVTGLLVSMVFIQVCFYVLLRWRLSIKMKFPTILYIGRCVKMYLNMNK